jgi:hypothetical protein
MLAPNTVVNGRYTIVRQLGTIGAISVYEATDARTHDSVFLEESPRAPDSLGRTFEHESATLRDVHHPSLPRVLDAFATEQHVYLVMEHVVGGDLADLIRLRFERGEGPFPLADVLRWGDEMLGALEYLHGMHPPVVHRNVTPRSLRLTPDGGLKLTGLLLPSWSSAETVGHIAHTPGYAALEQVDGSGADVRSDLYSVGATLHHLLTGATPEDAIVRARAALQRKEDPLRPVNTINTAVPLPVAGAIFRAMALNPDDRYATATMMRTALRAAAEVMRRPMSETAPLGGSLETVPGTEMLGASPGFDPMPAPEHLASVPRRRGSKLRAVLLAAAILLVLAVSGGIVALTVFGLPWLRGAQPTNAPMPQPSDAVPASDTEAAQRLAQVESALAPLAERGTRAEQLPGLGGELVTLADASGLTSLGPAPAPTIAGRNATIGPIEFAGSYSAFQEFFRKFGQNRRLIGIEKLSIRKAGPELLAKGLTAQATVNARVYVLAAPGGTASTADKIREAETAVAALNTMVRAQSKPSELLDFLVRHLPPGETLLDEIVIQGNSVTIRGTAHDPGTAERFAKALESDPNSPLGSARLQSSTKAREAADDAADSDDEEPDDLAAEFTIVCSFKP